MSPIYDCEKIHRVIWRDEATNPEFPWVSVSGEGRYTDAEVGTDLRQVWPS